jgi:N-sulfoglucosamine sulfohydrolase
MPNRWRIACLVCFAIGSAATTTADDAAANNGKNVILIVADDMGFQIGCYGDEVARTPGIDRLAERGTRFTRAGCTTASCSPSRSVLLTGLHNHANGMYGLAHATHHFSAYSSVRTLPVMLAEAGYRTCSVGKFHVAPEEAFHFEEYRNQGLIGGSRNSAMMVANAVEWIEAADERPFFLYYCSSDPHRGAGAGDFANHNDREENPYPGCERVRFEPGDMTAPPWLPDNEDVKLELAEYYQAINRFDQGVGALLDYLESSGQIEDTLVILLSDNGPPFPGAKTTLYQPGMNLPLIVASPDATARGTTCDARVSWVDIVPTILDFCDVTPVPAPALRPGVNGGGPEAGGRGGNAVPVTFHGRSFLDVVEQEQPEGWDTAFASHSFHEVTMYYPMRVVISGEHKLIFNIAHELPYPFASDLYNSPTWQGVLSRGDEDYGSRTVDAYLHRPRFELYNLVDDPWESHNLAEDPDHAHRLSELQAELQQWQVETSDPWELKWRYE